MLCQIRSAPAAKSLMSRAIMSSLCLAGQRLNDSLLSARRTNVVDIPTWLKFLGKIFTEEQKTGEQVSGCLIALSGVNGNCRGAYDDLKRNRSDIRIIAGDTLIPLLEQLYSLEKDERD